MMYLFKWYIALIGVIIVSICVLNYMVYRESYENGWVEDIEMQRRVLDTHFDMFAQDTSHVVKSRELNSKYDALGPRLRSFCNLPLMSFTGAEGAVSKDKYQLEAVFMVTRHGHRAPILPIEFSNVRSTVECDLNDAAIRRIGYPPLEKFEKHIHQQLRDTLKQLRATNLLQFAPGAPAASEAELLDSIYNDAYYSNAWNFFNMRGAQCFSGQISLFGIVQFLELGRFLRRTYIDNWGLLSATLDDQSTSKLYQAAMKTTGAQRTHLSGVSFMYSFLDLENFNYESLRARNNANVPGQTLSFATMPLPFLIKRVQYMSFCDQSSQTWLPPGFTCNCPAVSPLIMDIGQATERIMLSSASIQSARFALLDFIPPAGQVSTLELMDLLDLFVPDACYALKLPCVNSTSDVGGSRAVQRCMVSQLEDLLEATETLGRGLNEEVSQKRYSAVIMYPLLSEIVHRMQYFASSESSRTTNSTDWDNARFTHFSGHDFTISDLLRALALHRGVWPSYAARVVFELYSSLAKEGEESAFFIRVLYNGEDVTGDTEPCVNKTNEDGLCDFQVFRKYIFTDMLLKYAGASSFADACLSNPGNQNVPNAFNQL